MDFKIIFYKDDKGNSPVEEFLVELSGTNEALFNQASKAIEKIKNRAYHKEPLSKYLAPGLWELRVMAGTDILRIIYTFEKGQIVILLHSFIKKQRETPVGELAVARIRLKEVKMGAQHENTKR